MLSKLMKQDYLSTRRLFFPSYLVFIVIALMNKLMLELGGNSVVPTKAMDVFTVICMTLYIISIVSLYAITYVFICMHFYRTMSGEQGYLTHTLPVKTGKILNSKILSSILWQLLTFALIIISLLIMITGHTDGMTFSELLDRYNDFVRAEMFMEPSVFNLEMAITFIIGLFSGPLMFYCAIAIGHLFNKHKVGGAVIAYIGIYMIMQMLSTILLFISGFFTIAFTQQPNFYLVYNKLMIYSVILTLFTTIAFYFITEYIFKKRLNLE